MKKALIKKRKPAEMGTFFAQWEKASATNNTVYFEQMKERFRRKLAYLKGQRKKLTDSQKIRLNKILQENLRTEITRLEQMIKQTEKEKAWLWERRN